MVAVRDGMRVVNNYARIPSDLHTMVVEFEVERSLKGPEPGGSDVSRDLGMELESDRIYCEFIISRAVQAEDFAKHLSAERFVVLLREAKWRPSHRVTYLGEGKGYPAGARHYRLAFPGSLYRQTEAGALPVESSWPEAMRSDSLENLWSRLEAIALPASGTSQ